MRCDICKKNDAVVHIKQTRGNHTIDLHLCSSCAAERGIEKKNPQLEKALDTVFHSIGALKNSWLLFTGESECPHCGMALSLLFKKEAAGCPQCYEAFEKELNDNHFHDKIYSGRIPQSMGIYRTALSEIPDRKKQLQKAVAAEDYAEAQRLKEEIEQKQEALRYE